MLRTAQLLRSLFLILITIVAQSIRFLRLALSSRAVLSAEVLFLRKQLAFYREHQVRPRQLTDESRVGLIFLSRWFEVEKGPDDRPTGNADWLASEGVRTLLATEIENGETAASEKIRQLIVRLVKENPRIPALTKGMS